MIRLTAARLGYNDDDRRLIPTWVVDEELLYRIWSACWRTNRDPMLAQDLGDAHVGDLEAELEGFDLDPTISPVGLVSSE